MNCIYCREHEATSEYSGVGCGCGGGDGPGFYLCERKRCAAARAKLDVAGRRALYTSMRAGA